MFLAGRMRRDSVAVCKGAPELLQYEFSEWGAGVIAEGIRGGRRRGFRGRRGEGEGGFRGPSHEQHCSRRFLLVP